MKTKLLSRRVADLLLGPPGRRRMSTAQTLFSVVVYAFLALLQHGEVLLGLMDLRASNWLTASYLSGAMLFYVLVRSGLGERLAVRFHMDPSLTLMQTGFAVVMAAASYSITGPARGGVMTLLVLLMTFAMFSLRPEQSRRLASFAFLLLAAIMLWKSRTDPLRYPPAVEAIHGVWTVIVLGGVSVLAGRMGRLRLRLQTQKRDLEQALKQIGELARRDELTGLANRRRMSELLATEQERQRGTKEEMTVAMLDIDFFKRINDQHGHRAGDDVLRRFAEIGQRVLRPDDMLARWGGEEFLLMLPSTAPAQALSVIARLRETLADASFDGVAEGLRVTFSSGLTACGDDDALEACIERADQAMYRAKTEGRNRCVVA